VDYSQYKTPGQLLAKLIADRDWSQRLVAVILGVTEAAISKIMSDNLAVSAEMAIKFEDIFGVPAEVFLKLQQEYDLAKARITSVPNPDTRARATLFGELPIPEMIKRRWLTATDVRNVEDVQDSLVNFFGVRTVDEIEVLPHAAKKTAVTMPTSPAQLAWLYRVKRIADDMMTAKYSESAVRAVLPKLEELMVSAEAVRKVPRLLTECGIRYVICETISSAKIDGVCFWLDDKSPVIGMSLRFDRIDNFWFVLRHEIEHVLRKHGQSAIMLDAELEGDRAGTGESVPEEERVANEAAANFGVMTRTVDKFISRKAPFFKESDLLGFAATEGVHPGIIVGRLQYATKRFDLFRNHLVKIRSKIAHSAMVDGWGDVAPVGH
jgi:HTH-type transcriptional regulator/antitoxin HigA